MTAPRIAMPAGKPEFGTVFFVYRAEMHTGSSMHTAGAITAEQHRAIAAILQGKTAIYDGEPCTLFNPPRQAHQQAPPAPRHILNKETRIMRMAKASEQDIEAAMELMTVLNNVDSGYYPAQDDGEDAPTFFEPDDLEHLAFFFARVKSCLDAAPGFVGRVVCGMHTIMHNDILDPNEDCLALHPKFAKVAEQRDKLLAALTEIAELDMLKYHHAYAIAKGAIEEIEALK